MNTVLIIMCGALIVTVIALGAYALRLYGRASKVDIIENELAREKERSSMLERQCEESARRAERLQLALDRENARSQGSDHLEKILTPLQERIDLFNRAYADGQRKDAAERRSIRDQIDRLMSLNENIGREARSLTNALKHNGKVQGDWGEEVLRRILEQSGLTEGVHFITQQTRDESGAALRDDDGALLRPDVTILFPDERKLIVDSKVSLTDYLRLQEAQTDEEARSARRGHLASVRRHIDELARKNYQKVVKGAADYVLMFMPVEGAFIEASGVDRELWRYAAERKVVVVSPAHILAVLQLVSQLWRQENRSRNSEEMARQAGLLYDRFAAFGEELLKVGRAIDASHKAYDEALRRLSRGRTSLTASAQRLAEMGARTSKRIPEKLLDESEVVDESVSAGASAHESGRLEEEPE